MNYSFYLSTPLILCAIALDALAGDPSWVPHPVRLIGAAITRGESLLWSSDARRAQRNGAILTGTVVMISAGATWGAIALVSIGSNVAAAGVAVLVAWTALAMRGLDRAAANVELAVAADDLADARHEIRALVGRDPESLGHDGLIRAAVESVAENSSDGVIAPMLYLFAGGPAAAMAYKAINTMDSMIGYYDERYRWFGRAAARLDDFANLIPARLTALCLMASAAIVMQRGAQAYRACITSASQHRSPNAGYPESAMAGGLGIQLGGDAVYGGDLEHRAVLGIAERAPVVEDIRRARSIMRVAAAIAFGLIAAGRYAVMRAV